MRACRWLALLALALAAARGAVAAGIPLELQAYDLRKCVRWSITPAPQPQRTMAWRVARLHAKPPLQVFAATAELPEGGTLHEFGACSLRPEGRRLRLRCAPGLDFPLSGASFLAGAPQKFRTVVTFACATGCDQKIPTAVYQLRPVSPGDELQDKEEHQRSTPFRRACAGLR
jgi:hypothetical protein